MKKILTLAIICLAGLTVSAQQQTDSLEYSIETRDGNVYEGVIIKEDGITITLETKSLGTLTIQKMDIKHRTAIDPALKVRGQYWFPNPQATRYFFAPNGFGLKKGEGYYQNVMLFFNQFAYGVTDQVSIGGGMIPLFLFSGTPTPVWITPKVSIPLSNSFNIGAGGLLGTVVGESNTSFGVLYGSATIGSRDLNASVGLGWGYAEGDFSNQPTINLGFMGRLSRNSYFIGEMYILNTGFDSVVLTTLGGRSMIKRVGLDYGVVAVVEDGFFGGLPWLGVTIPISSNTN